MKHYLLLWLLLFSTTTVIGNSSADSYLQKVTHALEQKDGNQAKQILQEAYAAYPTDIKIISQLATLHYILQEFDQSVIYFEKLIGLGAENSARYNLAMTYCKLGRFNQALQQLEILAPKLPNEPAINSALLKLYARNKQWKKTENIIHPKLWWFDENIYGSTILLDIDKEGNGLGDGIQYVRYGRYLAQAGARVIVKAPKPLVPLLSRCPYISTIITKGDPIPAFDKEFSICIVSLMCKSKNRIAMNIPETAYLTADPALITTWQQRLASDHNFKIGLCWESNFIKNNFTGAVAPSPRAMSLTALQSIALPGVSFYSLQKKSDGVAPFAITQFDTDFDESHGRFMDTAALIMNCDLIISVDTSIAHLAGALGKPTWLLLNCESDYRWFMNDSRSYWYPSMRLFRQQQFGNWAPVIEQVKNELEKLLKK